MVSSGGIPALVGLLRSGPYSVQAAAAAGLQSLAQHSSCQPAISAAGAIPVLERLLLSNRREVRVTAAAALALLSTTPKPAR